MTIKISLYRLFEEQEMKEQYISHDVQLMGVIAHR